MNTVIVTVGCIVLFLLILSPVLCMCYLVSRSGYKSRRTDSIGFVAHDQLQLKASSLDLEARRVKLSTSECPVQLGCQKQTLQLSGNEAMDVFPNYTGAGAKRASLTPMLVPDIF